MPSFSVGRVRTVHKGTYNPGVSYGALERVLYKNSLYESTQNVPVGALPDAPGSLYWVLISAEGVPGKDGKAGKDGTNGTPGTTGAQGPQGPKGDAGSTIPISDSITSPDSGVAASSKAVKTVNDKVIAADEQIAQIQLTLTQVEKTVFYTAAETAPTDTQRIWIRLSDRTAYFHNGTEWLPIVGVYAETLTP